MLADLAFAGLSFQKRNETGFSNTLDLEMISISCQMPTEDIKIANGMTNKF
jgi:hypothetical protein